MKKLSPEFLKWLAEHEPTGPNNAIFPEYVEYRRVYTTGGRLRITAIRAEGTALPE